ncbi:MAG TPA: molybdate ABC transporter substrate-binding protein [Draconibacterium sp.]|nr:molybdate ABC transporter substrate-binding protein [Draconibacterium sp.]
MKIFVIVLVLLASIPVCSQTVKVAAAANLRFVFEEIKTAYESANPNEKISVNFGSSGALFQQILNGADFDIFMSADNSYPAKLKENGSFSGELQIYALGKLVLWSNTLDVSYGLKVLEESAVKHIVVAKPELAPYGDRALECLKNAGLFEKIKHKIIYADNISQTAQFAQTGNAEVAFLAMSLTLTPEMKGSVFIPDPKSYKPIEQSMLLLKTRNENTTAEKFMKFILSEKCKTIFARKGYFVTGKQTHFD